jgi:hypothetical protein
MMTVSITSCVAFGLACASVHLPVGSLAAGEGVGDLVHSILRRTLGVVGATFVLQAPVAGQRAGCLFDATFCLIGVLVGHGRPLVVEDGDEFGV